MALININNPKTKSRVIQNASGTRFQQKSKNVSEIKIETTLSAMLDAASQKSVKHKAIEELKALAYD